MNEVPNRLIEAAEFIEKRLVKTSSASGKKLDELNDYERGIHIALRECCAILRAMATGKALN